MKLQYLLVKSRMRKLLIMNVVWATVFSFKTNGSLVLKEGPVAHRGILFVCGFIPFYTFRHYFNASMTFGNIVQIVFSSCAVKKLPSISDFSSVAIPF